jgi:hypothetical protein
VTVLHRKESCKAEKYFWISGRYYLGSVIREQNMAGCWTSQPPFKAMLECGKIRHMTVQKNTKEKKPA